MLMNKGTSVHVMAVKKRVHEELMSAAQREEGYKENDYEMRHLVSVCPPSLLTLQGIALPPF